MRAAFIQARVLGKGHAGRQIGSLEFGRRISGWISDRTQRARIGSGVLMLAILGVCAQHCSRLGRGTMPHETIAGKSLRPAPSLQESG